jgi:hypothetical protein
MACRGILRIGRLAVEAPEYPSGDDAPMLAGELGVNRNRARRREVEIALEGQPERAAGGRELVQAHVAEFRFAEAEVAETEGEMIVRVQLREEPGGVAVRGEKLNDGFEVDGAGLLFKGGALGAAVLEEFLALGVGDQIHGFDSCLGGPQRSVHRTDGPRRVRPESNAAHQCPIGTDRGSTGRDSGFALARAVRSKGSMRSDRVRGGPGPIYSILNGRYPEAYRAAAGQFETLGPMESQPESGCSIPTVG